MTTLARGGFPGAVPERADTNWQQLIERASHGTVEAENQLDRELRRCIRASLRRHFSPCTLRRAGGIADLTQLTLIRFFRRVGRGLQCASRAATVAYVCKIAYNCVRAGVRYYVGAQKRSRDREEPFDLRRHDRPAPDDAPGDAMALDEQCRAIAKALTPAHADLFVAIVAGEPLGAFAERHGVHLRTVRTWLSRLTNYVTAHMASIAGQVCAVRRHGSPLDSCRIEPH